MLTLTVRPRRSTAGVARVGGAEAWAGAALLIAVAVAGTVAWGPNGPVIALALAPAVAAAVVDHRTGRVPDRLVVVSCAVTGSLAAVASLAGRSAFPAVIAGALAMMLPLLLLHLAAPDAMGFGDVKLAVPLGAVVGIADWRLALVVLALASGAALMIAVARRRSSIAFGPALVTATSAVVLLIATLGWEVPRWR